MLELITKKGTAGVNPNGPKETTEKGTMITQDEIIKAEDAAEETLERVETMPVPETSALRAAIDRLFADWDGMNTDYSGMQAWLCQTILTPEVLKEALMPYWQELRRKGGAYHCPVIAIRLMGSAAELSFRAQVDVLHDGQHHDTIEAAMVDASPAAKLRYELAEAKEKVKNLEDIMAHLEGGAK